MKCCIYTRVSTRDGRQDPANQLRVLSAYAAAAQWNVSHVFTDHETGKHLDRPGFQAMMTAADRREFDVLLFWRLDRLTRSGVLDTLATLETLDALNIDYHSHQEQLFRSAGPVGKLIVSIHATLAQIEREAIAERTRAGIDRARSNGKRLGRPPRVADRDVMRQQRQHGASLTTLAKTHGVSKATAYRMTK